MSMWLYQMSQTLWSPERYRLDIWEGERWSWPVGRRAGRIDPERGDTVVFFYSATGGDDPGFYGWAVILDVREEGKAIYFRTVPPSDYLKMCPWWDESAQQIANEIRGKVRQGTLWPVPTKLRDQLRVGIRAWVGATGGWGQALISD